MSKLPIVWASGFEAKGTLVQVQSNGDDPAATNMFWFDAIVDRCTNCIRFGELHDPTLVTTKMGAIGPDAYLITYFSNLVTHDYIEMHNGVPKFIHSSQPIEVKNDAMLVINRGPLPANPYMFVIPPWLAFAASCTLSNHSTQNMPFQPMFFLASIWGDKGGLANISYESSGEEPFLPQSLVQTVEPKDFKRLGLSSPISEVSTTAIFKVLHWTNAAHLLIPKEFRAEAYLPLKDRSASSKRRIVIDGSLTELITDPGIMPKFDIPSVTRIVEKRPDYVAPLPDIAYTTDNGELWDRPKTLAEAKRQSVARHITPPVAPRWARAVIWLFFAILLILPPLYFSLTRLKKQTVKAGRF
jgi:hypothetical protein